MTEGNGMIAADTEEEGTRELLLKGALVMQRAAELKEEIQKALGEVDTLIINLNETSEMDLSCIQLLCAAHRAAVALNKTLVRVGRPRATGIFQGMDVTDAGSCSFASDQGCIWAGE